MKIAVLGNSHTASLKMGLGTLQDIPGLSALDVTFYALGRNNMRQLEIRDDRLVVEDKRLQRQLKLTSGGHTSIDTSRYDLFILHGMGLNFSYRLLRHRFFSQQVASACFEKKVTSSVAYSVYEKLRLITDKPAVISPCPLLAEGAPDLDTICSGPWNPTINYELFMDAIRKALKIPGDRAIAQPTETRADRFATIAKFTHGSTRMLNAGATHTEDDYCHMNADYGRLWWQALPVVLRGQQVVA